MNCGAALSSVATRRGLITAAIRGLKPTATVTGSLRDQLEVDASASNAGAVTSFFSQASMRDLIASLHSSRLALVALGLLHVVAHLARGFEALLDAREQ